MNEHQKFEADWWGLCSNTYFEEQKQLVYAKYMGLLLENRGYSGPVFDAHGAAIIDIGGGPVSMLLKTVNREPSVVIDPCPYPEWVTQRYREAGIYQDLREAENWDGWKLRQRPYDEAWIYNVLQHVEDPEAVVRTAMHARVVRIFEWVYTPPTLGHPHTLIPEQLDEWLGHRGVVGEVNELGASGTAYWNIAVSGVADDYSSQVAGRDDV